MVNIERLKSAMRSKNITVEQASEHIGVNPATFYRRISREGEKFTVSEVGKLAELLDMDSSAMQDIFLTSDLRKCK